MLANDTTIEVSCHLCDFTTGVAKMLPEMLEGFRVAGVQHANLHTKHEITLTMRITLTGEEREEDKKDELRTG